MMLQITNSQGHIARDREVGHELVAGAKSDSAAQTQQHRHAQQVVKSRCAQREHCANERSASQACGHTSHSELSASREYQHMGQVIHPAGV